MVSCFLFVRLFGCSASKLQLCLFGVIRHKLFFTIVFVVFVPLGASGMSSSCILYCTCVYCTLHLCLALREPALELRGSFPLYCLHLSSALPWIASMNYHPWASMKMMIMISPLYRLHLLQSPALNCKLDYSCFIYILARLRILLMMIMTMTPLLHSTPPTSCPEYASDLHTWYLSRTPRSASV